MARPRPYSTNGGGGSGGGVDPSRKKLLNTLGMFRQLESYESSQALRGTRSSTNSKKKRHHHHHHGLHHQHVGNDTNGNRPIKPQHIRHHSDMSFLGVGVGAAAAGGGPLNANNANVDSTGGGGGGGAASGVIAGPIVRPTRSALHNSTGYFQTTLNDIDDEDVDVDADDNVVGNASNTKDATTTNSTPPPSRQDSGDDDDEGGRRQVDNKLRFHNVVSVVEIPSHAQYSNRVKSSLWRDRHELNEMVQRNITEFDYENYDWKSVVEEADFYIDGSTGERVHPAHVMLDEDDEEDEEEEYEGEEQGGADSYHYANEALQQLGGSRGQGESKQEKVIQINSTAHFDGGGGGGGGNESDGPPMLHRSAPVMGGSDSSGGVDAGVLAEKLSAVAVMVDEKENGSSNSTNVQQQEKSNSSNDNTDNTADGDDDEDDDDHFFLPLRRYGSQKLQ
eukprot:CAMPEP_0113461090 /NCGR_PEP_ID=MMETSP0014_2-20120614/11352_1 /TAXON_ID=2857 /ORGANISM="Nitzschia sp." /LENGTH=448 /DNA_ID=CAMNT_0000352821 /DNA_START=238 /DNA_END=1584 /DNA_ORIENTATION=+ /assembly_acc=CAM_ASM_000159